MSLGATENGRLAPLRDPAACRSVALQKAGMRTLRHTGKRLRSDLSGGGDQESLSATGVMSVRHETRHVHWSELDPRGRPKRIQAKSPEVLVEVSAAR